MCDMVDDNIVSQLVFCGGLTIVIAFYGPRGLPYPSRRFPISFYILDLQELLLHQIPYASHTHATCTSRESTSCTSTARVQRAYRVCKQTHVRCGGREWRGVAASGGGRRRAAARPAPCLALARLGRVVGRAPVGGGAAIAIFVVDPDLRARLDRFARNEHHVLAQLICGRAQHLCASGGASCVCV